MVSIVLAKILALYFVAIGVAFLLDPLRFKKMLPAMLKDENFLLLGAITALLFGAVIVSIHNIWVLGWPVLITLLGWWSLIKGYGILIYSKFPNYFSFILNRSDIFYRTLGSIYLLLGLFLGYHGWF